MVNLSAIPAAFIALISGGNMEQVPVTIETIKGDAQYNVEIADDPFEQIRGLMYRDNLPSNAGMLFVYEADISVRYWMKNVAFPLDMIFIDRCAMITQIHRNAQPGDPTIIASNDPVRAVLEIRGNASKSAQMRIGDKLKLPWENAAKFEDCPIQ